jgi:hypothetical protein
MEAEMPQLSSSQGAPVADRARARAGLARARARQTAADIAPLAKTAVEAMRQAADTMRQGADTMRQGADELAAWAGPQVRKSRSWAAPQLERTGVLVQEKLAPQVSEALTRAARKLDPEPAPRRRGLRGLLAIGLAAAGAAVAVLVVRKKTGLAASQPDEDGTDEPGSSTGTPEDTAWAGNPDEDSRADANGHIRSTP